MLRGSLKVRPVYVFNSLRLDTALYAVFDQNSIPK